MIDRDREPSLMTLPAELPIFPLTGAVLLPGGQLPLNIFEPRYLNMVEDALGAGRMIGMIQPGGAPAGLTPDDIALCPVGCAGRIIRFAETDDGRYLITLEGIVRFKVAAELPLHDGYRRVRPDYRPFEADLDDFADTGDVDDRDALLAAMRTYFERKGIAADLDSIENAPDDVLVTTLSMSCPLDPRDKQALLECPNTNERGRLLTRMFQFAVHEGNGPASDLRQ